MDKNLVRGIIAAFCILILALAVAGGISATSGQLASPTDNIAQNTGNDLSGQSLTKSTETSTSSESDAVGRDSANPKANVAATIQDSDLEYLASTPGFQDQLKKMDAGSTEVNREYWAKALPQAEALEKGPCSCAQRNWLGHFIECAKYATAGDPKYFDSMKVLVSTENY